MIVMLDILLTAYLSQNILRIISPLEKTKPVAFQCKLIKRAFPVKKDGL